MPKINSSIAFALLVCMFLLSLLFASYQTDILWIAVFFAVLSTSAVISSFKLLSIQACGVEWKKYPKSILAVSVGAITTFYLVKMGLSAVLASSLVGIVGSLLIKHYETEIFTGSFVGMSSVFFFSDGGILVASLIASIAYLMGKNVFIGIGGKLGSSAFIGTLLVALFAGADVWNLDIAIINTALPQWFFILSVMVSALASVMTYQLAQLYFKGSVVIGSSVVGIFGYVLSLFFGPLSGLFAGTIFAASFAGMSQIKVLKNPLYFAIAGLMTAIIFLASSTYFLGLGGKMGTSAFIGVLATCAFIKRTN